MNSSGEMWHGGIAPLSFQEARAAGEAMWARWKQNAGEPPYEEGDSAWYDLARCAFETVRDIRAAAPTKGDAQP
jgi:hypothetical protein